MENNQTSDMIEVVPSVSREEEYLGYIKELQKITEQNKIDNSKLTILLLKTLSSSMNRPK
jgi:hypothetical protein